MPIGHEEHERIPEQTPTGPGSVDFATLETETKIGTGGTADVVKMTDTQSGTVVAVKQPRLEGTLNQQVADKFVREAETWEKLDGHDGIVGVVGWEEKPLPRIGLEYMDGGPLTDRVGKISLDAALWTGIRVADAVWEAHRQGVAHLDLKPENILFRTTPASYWDVPKVSDWGLARLLLHHSQSVSGLSPQYSAPEQFDPDAYGQPDNVTDIYQLGTIIYELLTGTVLFAGQATTVMNKHLTETPVAPTEVDGRLPVAVDYVLRTALAKEKTDRYESMLDFRRDLTALFRQIVLDGDPSFVYQERWTEGRDGMRGDKRTRTGRSAETGKETERPGNGAGTPFSSDDETGSILDNIQEQSRSETSQRFPWQRRDEAPGLEKDVDGTLERKTHTISSQTRERLREIPEESQGDVAATADSDGGLSWILDRILRWL